METSRGINLPECGLAEDILSRFIDDAQQEINNVGEDSGKSVGPVVHHLVTFKLGNEEYGIEIGSVQEIIRAADITPVPGAPAHVRGVINIRGKIIPVVDLAKRFRLSGAETDDAQRIVVVELGEKRLGMLVDSVSQVIKVPSGIVEDLPEEASSLDDHFIKGIGKLDDRLIIILDLNNSLLSN